MNNNFLGGFDAPTLDELNAAMFPPCGDLRDQREGTQTPNNRETRPLSLNSTSSTEALDGHTAALDFAPAANVSYALTNTFEAALEAMQSNTPVAPETDLFGASTSSDTDWYTFRASYSRRAPRTPVVAKMNLYLFISPYTFIPTAPLTFVTYFAEDFRNPAIVAEVEAHNMPWNKRCFAIVTPLKKDICGKEVLMLDGSIQGRWTVEEKVYETDMHAFIRIKDRRRRLLAVMAFPRHRVEMPTPSEFTCLFYERILKEPATTAHTQDITEPILDDEETYIGERFVELS
ncbi:hypothetical protein DFH06DRAFT_1318348 [Mycena polygramma]|nr:hypothetical protein DFH06DRAFT_1321992 [Mycena polygramma]KAJ7982884.1 hypothetical protein DFH06DRAFT_1318348 [Mycena polygramma]